MRRTAWQHILVTNEELDHDAALETLYVRAQLRERCVRLHERMYSTLPTKFAELARNLCPHTIDTRKTWDAPARGAFQAARTMSCGSCGASVRATVETVDSRPVVVYRHSIPLHPITTTGASTLSVGDAVTITSSENSGTFNITKIAVMEHTNVTVSGTTMKNEDDV